jgi:hypothetical protein
VTSPVKTVQGNRRPAQLEPSWIVSVAKWLTPRRIRAQAIVLALCTWGVCAVDFATPGLFDRAGNLKFQDFLPIYISARLVAQGRAAELYNQQVTADSMQAIIRKPNRLRLPNLYGPQVGLFFVPLVRFSFPVAARICAVASLLIFFACLYFLWMSCPNLRPHFGTVAICTFAFPPLFHFFVRGQLSALVLACFTAAFLAFRGERSWLAGAALGFLIFKPQFLVAIPLVLLLSQAWKTFAGLVFSAGAQLLLTRIYFGPALMHAYFDRLWHVSRLIGELELNLAPIQMHSLRSFWTLPIPSPEIALGFYILTSIAVIAVAALIWKSSAALALRFSALMLAAVLVNPHLFVYDLLILAPVLLLLVDWTLTNPHPAIVPTMHLLLYLAYVLPLFGPLSRWTHVQLSVPAFATLLWILWRCSLTRNHKLASDESVVV